MYEVISKKTTREIVSMLRAMGFEMDILPSYTSNGVKSSFAAAINNERRNAGAMLVIFESAGRSKIDIEALSRNQSGQLLDLEQGEQLCRQIYMQLSTGDNSWSCPNCGRPNDEDTLFCINCGTPQGGNSRGNEFSKENVPTPPPKPINKTAIIIAAIVVVGILAGIFLFTRMTADSSNDTEAENEEITTEESYDSEFPNNGNDPYYVIGDTYQILTNLRVREGPGKEYRILNRDELTADDYANSVDSKKTTDALMEKGKYVYCMGMQGDWMRIDSGWICVYDEGEVLVR